MKRKDWSFVLLSADISHPWQGTQRFGFVLRLRPPPLPVSLWLIWAICEWSRSQWCLSHRCTVASACLWMLGMLENIKWKHHNRSCGIYADLNERKKKKKPRAEKGYILTVTTAHCSVVTAFLLQHVFAIKWPCSVEHKRNVQIWIYHMATREPYVSFDFRRPFWTNGGVR